MKVCGKLSAIIMSVYGLLLLVGGIIGYATAQSLMSLLMGGACALISFIAAFGIWKGCQISKYMALTLSSLLTLFFGYRFWLTQKFMPGGLMLIISLAVVIFLVTYSCEKLRCGSSKE